MLDFRSSIVKLPCTSHFPAETVPRPASLKTFAESLYQQLRDEILRGELKPGHRLTEQEIAQRMGTSLAPVREALARLRAQGLVLTLPHRGSYVSAISTELARDVYAVRIVLEQHAASLALPRLTDADIDEFRAMVEAMIGLADDPDFMTYVACDMRFHRRMFEHSGSQTLLQFWSIIEAQTTKFIAVASPPIFLDRVAGARTHFALTDAMATRDLSLLQREISEHLLRIWTSFEG